MTAGPTANATPRPRLRMERSAWLLAGLAAVGLWLGVAVAALGVRHGPWVPVALALLLLVVVGGAAEPRWAVAAVFAAMPVGAVEVWVGPFGVPAIQIAVLGCAALTVLARASTGQTLLPWPATVWSAAAIAGAAVLETPLAVDPDAALKQDAQLVVGVLMALTVVAAARRMEDVRWLVGVVVLVGGAVCLFALASAGQLRPRYGGAVVENRAHGVFTEPNQLGSFSAILFFLACALWLGGRSSRVRAAAGGLALVAFSSLALSLSRGSWLGTATGAVGLLALLPLARRRLLRLAPVVLLALLALVAFRPDVPQLAVVNERLQTFSNPTGNPWDARPGIYREAWHQIRDRPLTGFGPGGFTVASSRPESEVGTVGAYHAHNVLLTVAAEMGVPVTAMLVWFTLSVGTVALRTVRRLRRQGRARDAALVAGLAAALLMVVGQGLVDFTLRNPIIVVLVWSLAGLVLAADRISARAAHDAAGEERVPGRLAAATR